MNLKTLIIDDEPIALEKLASYVEKTPWLDLTAKFDNAADALEFLASNEVDLIFTDIQMPDLNGLDMVMSLEQPPMVVFTTAFRDYALDSYRVRAIDYLLKPYGIADFQRAASRALQISNHTPTPERGSAKIESESLFVKVDYRYIRVNLSDIRYIKGYGEYLQIHVIGHEMPLLTLSSFQAVIQRLSHNFLQIHRSYIVNMDQVLRIERNRVVMDEETYLPISEGCKASLQDYLNSQCIGPTK